MPKIIGPYRADDDTTPAQLALTANGINSIDKRILALETIPGRVALSYTQRPGTAPEWAWGFSNHLYPDPAKGWVNAKNPDDDRGIIYTNVHEYGHQWWAMFGTNKLRNALKALAIGVFGGDPATRDDDYESSFAEFFADTFARATTGGRFNGILRKFYRVTCDPTNYGKFVDLCLQLHRVSPVPAEPPVVPPPLTDPVLDALHEQIATLTVALSDAEAARVSALGSLADAESKIAAKDQHSRDSLAI